MADPNTNYGPLLTTTLANYQKTLVDNIFAAIPLLGELRKKERTLSLTGGHKIVLPIMYGTNSTAKSYEGYEVLDTTPQDGISAAEYNWKQVSASITISGKEEMQNDGENAIINLAEAKTDQAEMSIVEAVSDMIFGDGTGNSSKDLEGLQKFVADSPSTGTVGNINRATYSWWRNNQASGAKTSTAFDNLLSAMRAMYNDCSKGKGRGKDGGMSGKRRDVPDLIFADQTVYEGYDGLLLDQKRFTGDDKADGGFERLKFKGAVVDWDPAMDGSGRMYFLNSRYLRLAYHAKRNFVTTPFIRPENQDAMTAQILFMGNLVCSNCSKQGVLTSIT